jgi:hypothetical protein
MEATHELATKTDKQLSVHEAVCAERYANIQKRFDDGSKRMQRIEYILYCSIAVSLFGPKYMEQLLKHLIGV